LKLLKVPAEKEDPTIILNTMYLDWQKDNNPPFYLSLGTNGLSLNNCMLDFRASTNVMSLKVMEQLGLKKTRPYGNVFGIDSKKVKVCGLCEDVEVYLIEFPHISLIMNIVVIDFLDAWGMLLSRIWSVALGGFLNMDLTHTNIPMGDGTFEILYSQERDKKHVMHPNSPDYTSESDFDVPRRIIDYDPWDLPFAQEDFIDTPLTSTNEYNEKLMKFQGRETGSIQILKKEHKENKECEKSIKDAVNTEPPSYPYIEDIPYNNYNEGILAFRWDNRKGKPKYDKNDKSSWLGPYIIKKNSEKEKY